MWPMKMLATRVSPRTKPTVKMEDNATTATKAQKTHACDQCEKKFKTKGELKQHSSVHSDERPFRCSNSQCSKSFKKKSHLQSHIARRTCRNPLTCERCQKTFPRKRHLTIHIREHTQKDLRNCPNKFKTNSASEVHLVTHTKSPRTKSSVNWEGNATATEKPQKTHACDQCGKEFKTKYHLKMHSSVHSDERSFRCSNAQCSKSFKRKWNLERHMMTQHTGHKPFACPRCQKTFDKKYHLTIHMREHTQKSFKVCPHSPNKFKTNSALNVHRIITHTKSSRFICLFCNYTAQSQYSLENHLRAHTQEMPHICTECQTSFPTESSLKAHLRSKYKCNSCDYSAVDEECLAVHMRQHEDTSREVSALALDSHNTESVELLHSDSIDEETSWEEIHPTFQTLEGSSLQDILQIEDFDASVFDSLEG